MTFNFDEVIERRRSNCSKWDTMEAHFGVPRDEGLAMWTADMDFRPPTAVAAALQKTLDHGVFGYFGSAEPYCEAIAGWLGRYHGWQPETKWIAQTHGIVPGIGVCLRAFTQKGDGVIVFSPVYHAFYRIVEANERRIVESELVLQDGAYHMDLDALAAQLDGSEKMVLLCSPHNPSGRVWTPEELRALAAFCKEHDLILVSDEIHCDLVFPGAEHTNIATVCPEYMDRIIVAYSSTKTFNIAGIETGSIIIPDDDLRRRFNAAHMATGKSPNMFGMHMAEAAFRDGDAWLADLLVYLRRNRDIIHDGLNAIPGVNPMPLQSTYLAWVDFNGTGLTPAEVKQRVYKTAKLVPSPGAQFGAGGENWLRFNFATRTAMVEEAVARLHEAFSDLQ